MSLVAVDKPVPLPPQAPESILFPSQLCSELDSTRGSAVKQELNVRTPVTPPTAYIDFLKAHKPVLVSPPPTTLSRKSPDTSNASKNTLVFVQLTSTECRISGGSTTHFRSLKAPHRPPTIPAGSSQDGPALPTTLRIPQQHPPIFSPVTCPSSRAAMSSITNVVYLRSLLVHWSTSPSQTFVTHATPRSTRNKLFTVRSVNKRKNDVQPSYNTRKRRETASTTSTVLYGFRHVKRIKYASTTSSPSPTSIKPKPTKQ